MAAAVIWFERFKQERQRQQTGQRVQDSSEQQLRSPFEDWVRRNPLNERQIAHRRAILSYLRSDR
jgi:hypothetical protein